MPKDNPRGPLDPIFDVKKRRGAVQVGNSYPSEYVPPGEISDFVWYTTANGGEYPVGGIDATDPVIAGQSLLYGSNFRTGGAGPTTEPTFTGTATLGASSTVAAVAGYDTLGASRGSSGIWMASVTGSGDLTIPDRGSAQYVDWALVLTGFSGVAQTARSTADSVDAVSLSLPAPPTKTVLCVVQYGGAAGTDGISDASPSGFTLVQLVGRTGNITSLEVMIFVGAAQSISFNMGGGIPGGAVLSGGRDAVLLELS
jgi:hypothetical protein